MNRTLPMIAVAVVLVIGATTFAIADDKPTRCFPGEWAKVTVTQPNGERSVSEVRRQLPEGYSAEFTGGGDHVTIHSDGRVQARGGEVTIECIQPTH